VDNVYFFVVNFVFFLFLDCRNEVDPSGPNKESRIPDGATVGNSFLFCFRFYEIVGVESSTKTRQQ